MPTDDHNEPGETHGLAALEVKCFNVEIYLSQNEVSMHSILRPAACCNKIKIPRLHKCFMKKKVHIKLKKGNNKKLLFNPHS